MRSPLYWGAVLVLATLAAQADETLPVLKVRGDVYSNVTVTAITPTDIYFKYPGGMGNAKLRNLDPALQRHFGYDAAKAQTLERQQAQANAQYHRELLRQPAPRPATSTDTTPVPPSTPTAKPAWGTDLPKALAQARAEHKRVLLDFTGSDWCPWCIKFDHEVLSTARFATYAKQRLVLVRLDFPHQKPQSASLKATNAALARRFGIDGFPTYILLDETGKELGRQVGYRAGGPEAFIAELEAFGRH